jgi:hypothetical protein
MKEILCGGLTPGQGPGLIFHHALGPGLDPLHKFCLEV